MTVDQILRDVTAAQQEYFYPQTKSGRELAETMVNWFVGVEDDFDMDAWVVWVSLIRAAEREAVRA